MQPSLVFTTANWAAPQTVTVRGVDDSVADGNQQYRAILGAAMSGDANYDGLDAADVTITNVDNDKAGITVGLAAGNTTEAGGTTTFAVVLDSQPTADVTIPMSSSNTNEGTVMAASLVFTTVNWAAPQTVTVRGVNDNVADGNQIVSNPPRRRHRRRLRRYQPAGRRRDQRRRRHRGVHRHADVGW